MFSINENQEITVRHGVHHDNPSTIVSKMLKADLPDSNKMIKYMFKPQIDAMNRRIQCFNHEKKILKELDLFVLDTSLQEFPSCQNEFTIEKKWKIYNEVKNTGINNIVIASFPCATHYTNTFLRSLIERGEDMSNNFAMVDCIDINSQTKGPKDQISQGLQKCKEFGIQNVVLQLDLVYNGIDYGRFNVFKMFNLLSMQFRWIRSNLSTHARIFVNIRDFSESMKRYPARVFCLVNYLSALSDAERIFGICYEDGGKFYSEQMAVWTCSIREEMKRFGWYNGHLLVNIREQYGLSSGTTLDCLADGATGVWSGLSDEGFALGQTSSCLTIMNLIRVGNKCVLENFKCYALRKASRNIMKITTGSPPHPRQPVTGDRAIDIGFNFFEDMNFMSGDKQDADYGSLLLITYETSARTVVTKLKHLFGDENGFSTRRAEAMIDIMLHDSHEKKCIDYDSKFGLAKLYVRSGGEATTAIREIIEKVSKKSDQFESLRKAIRLVWENSEGDGEKKDFSEIDFCCFYQSFMSPYFANSKDNQVRKTAEAISLCKNGKVKWNDFCQHVQWAMNQYPDNTCINNLLKMVFRKRIFPLMNLRAHDGDYQQMQDDDYYLDYNFKHDIFFTANGSNYTEIIEEEFISGQVVSEVHTEINQNEFLEDLQDKIKYEVSLKTGEVSDCMFIEMIGDQNFTVKIPLTDLKCDTENLFEVQGIDVGEISSVRVGRYEGTNSRCVFYEIILKVPSRNSTFYFEGKILEKNVTFLDLDSYGSLTTAEDDFEIIDTTAGCKGGNKITYNIRLSTGAVPGCETKSNAYIILYGDKGFTEKLLFRRLKEKTENIFLYDAKDVGNITRIRIGHEIGTDCVCWYLDKVVIEVLKRLTTVRFDADRWIGTRSSSLSTLEVDLYPDTQETVCYEITVTTGGKDSGRLMQSDAYIILFGDKAMTGKFPMGRLKQNYKNTFTINAVDVGKVHDIKIGHEAGSDVLFWHLVDVQIQTSCGDSYTIAANRWIGNKDGLGILDCNLSPNEEGDNIKYDVSLTIGDVAGACQEFDVYINILGEDCKETGKCVLSGLKGNALNCLTVEGTDIGDLSKIRIGHEGTKDVPSWYLINVEVSVAIHGYKNVFRANKQLGGKNGSLDVDLYPNEKAFGNEVSYEVRVQTGDVPDECSDAYAYIKLCGPNGSTGKLRLKRFKKSKDNLFKMTGYDVGKITSIRIGHEAIADYKSWHLSEVTVNVPERRSTSHFSVCRRLGTKGEDWVRDICLFPDEDQHAMIEEVIEEPIIVVSNPFQGYKVQYVLHIITGQVPDCKKKSNGYITLVGERGFTGKLQLKELEEYTKNTFTLEAEEIGKIIKIRIGHDAQEDRPCWHLIDISIEVPVYGSSVCFHADRWLGTKGHYAYTLDMDLYPKGKVERVNYDVTIKTGGTDTEKHVGSNSYIIIYGGRETGKYPLKFLKENQNNTFSFEAPDVGIVRSIRIGHEYKGSCIWSWYLCSVELKKNDHVLQFQADKWIGTDRVDCALDVELHPEEATVDYEITLNTGSIILSGTDTSYINIFGDKKQTGKLPLPSIKENMENKIVVQAIDVGRIDTVRIGHITNKDITCWQVHSIGISTFDRDEKIHCIANRDLGKNGTLEIDVHPDKTKTTEYEICLKTDVVPDETENPFAYITLFGSLGETGKLPICSIKSVTTNTYKMNAKDVGDISYLRFGHEMHANFSTWFLQGITVQKSDDCKISFPAKQNISSEDDGHAFDLELFPKIAEFDGDYDFESELLELLIEELIPVPTPMLDWNVNYEVHLVTGEVPDQTLAKSSPYIILCGEQGFTGKLPLKGLKEKEDNVFMLETEEIGKIFKIRIGVDAQSDCSCWCLDKVYIKVPIYNSKVTFEADRWIGTHGLQPCTTEVDLYPSGTDTTMVDYEIYLETGGVSGSYIDQNAYIMLFGTNGETGKFPLGRLKQGYKNHVNLHAVDIGKLRSITFGHEEGAIVTRWHLKELQVFISGENTINVPADRWIGTKGGPCTLDADLYPENEGEIIDYSCFMKEEGLDFEHSNVYLNIFGEERSTGRLALVDLKRTNENRFILRAVDVGSVTKIRVGHDGRSEWLLKEITMNVTTHGSRILFSANRKLGTKDGQGTLDVNLYPKEKAFEVCYEVCVKTGFVPDEGQIANAYIEMHGTKGDTGKYPLEMLMDNFDNQFKFNAIDIGRILCIRIGHESNADYKSWLLLEVSVNVPKRGVKEYFPANLHIGTMGKSCLRDIELTPEKVHEDLIEDLIVCEEIIEPVLFEEYFKVKYLVSLVTGEIPDTQDKSNAFIVLMGERGFTGKLPLKRIKENYTNVFDIEAEEVGKLLTITIGHDVMADRTCWNLKEVYVEVPFYGSKVTFPADRWIGTKGDHPCTYDVNLYPKGKAKSIRYEFQVRSGGSNAGKHIKENIYVMIFGDKDETGKYPVEHLKKKSQNTFFIDAINVGKVNSIRIGHEAGKDIDRWYLSEIVLATPHNERAYTFTVDRWIGTKGARCTLDVELTPDEDVNIQYQIELGTGEIPHMGDDANAFINIFGDKRQTGKLPIAKIKENETNYAVLQAIDVGAIRKIRVGHESNDGISEWYIGIVSIRVPAHQSHHTFTALRSLGGDGVFDMDLYPDNEDKEHKIDYDVRVTTGDVTDDGKNSNTYIIISGRNGETGKLPLKGMMSFFDNINILDAVDVGKISFIRIGHEISANISNWHLDSVEIRRAGRPTLYFPAVCNLGTNGNDLRYDAHLFPVKKAPTQPEKLTIKDVIFQGAGSTIDECGGKVEYSINLVTGVVPTDGASPYLILFGEQVDSGKICVQNIEEGHTSTVACLCADLGKLTKIRVGQDGKANRTCWHLQDVSVQMPNNGKNIKFSADKWIGTKGTYPWTLDADFFPEDKAFQRTYEIKIKTGGKLTGKRINGHAYIILYGLKGDTGKIPVDRLKQSEVSTLSVQTCDIGKLTCVRIGHESGSNVNCWYLLGVAVTDNNKTVYTFPANRWIGTKGGSCTLDADIFVRESEMRRYIVHLKTGDIPDGCIEPNIYINIFGKKKNTGKLPLKVIRANDTHIATLMSLDVGPIRKIRVGHEQPRIFTTWQLDAVHIEIPSHKESFTFPADRQIGGYGTLDVDLYPENAGHYAEYQLYIKTKDVPDENEHANLYIILYGEKFDTGKLPIKSLKCNYDNYETIRAIDVGKINYIRFGHECTANYKSWQLCEIVVINSHERSYFSINRILGTKGEKWTMDITAFPTKEVKTNEFLTKVDVPDMSDMIPLMDDQDEEEVMCEDEAVVESAGNEEEYLKMLEQPEVANIEAAVSILKVEVGEEVLMADESTVVESAGNEEEYLAMLGEPDVVEKTKVLENTTYLITVKTGDIGGAGTDAHVYITLYGNDGHSGKIMLDYDKTELQNIFERNHEDSFTFVAPDVGHISKIRIGHDNSGSFSKWYLETLQIEVPVREETYKFTASRWLSKTDGDKQTEIKLYPSAYHKVEATTYVITVKTGDCYGAGTDANVIVQLFGEKGQSEDISLNIKCLIFGEYIFERSSLDMFLVQATDVGQIKSVRIAHDNEGGYAGWYLDWVGVRAHDYNIKCVADRWLDQYTGDKQLDITIHPNKKHEKLPAVQRMSSNVLKGATRIYDIYVKTGDVMWAGTDAVVYITLYGENGKTNKVILENSKSYKKPFERKQNDVFTVEALDVGDISKVRIGHDGTGVGAGWYIEGVCITAPGTKFIWTFVAKRWLDVSSGDKKLECDILPTKTTIS